LKIKKDDIEIFTIYGNKVNRQPFKADIDASDTEKGTYPHYMMKEIEEQPFVIRKIMSEYSERKWKYENFRGNFTTNKRL